jgi:hypothetical protein
LVRDWFELSGGPSVTIRVRIPTTCCAASMALEDDGGRDAGRVLPGGADAVCGLCFQ